MLYVPSMSMVFVRRSNAEPPRDFMKSAKLEELSVLGRLRFWALIGTGRVMSVQVGAERLVARQEQVAAKEIRNRRREVRILGKCIDSRQQNAVLNSYIFYAGMFCKNTNMYI